MNQFDAFTYFWLALVSFIGLFHLAWGVHDLRRGVAKWGWMGAEYARDDEPFYFWMTVIARFAGVVVAAFMFWFGLSMFNWK